jgi:hypothetical protein
MLSVESAATLPDGANLISFSGTDLQYYRGLTDNLQIELGTSGLSFFAPVQLGLRAQAKYHLLDAGPISLGAGLGGTTSMPGSASFDYGANLFVPISWAVVPGLQLNLVPRLGYDTALRPGADLGVAYNILPNFLAIAEDHVKDFGAMQHDVLVGGAYTGFGPRTTMAFGVVSGEGSATKPYSLGLGATLHQGF